MDKPLIVDLPYPNLDCIENDEYSARIIAPAYSSSHSELGAILQYIYHHFYFEEYGDEEIAKVIIGISVAEMKHLEIIGELLLRLGVDPIFTKNPPYRSEFFTTAYLCYSKTTKKMLLDDISGELLAIETYKEMLSKLKNEDVSAVISRIIIDEELHVKALKECLKKVINNNN